MSVHSDVEAAQVTTMSTVVELPPNCGPPADVAALPTRRVGQNEHEEEEGVPHREADEEALSYPLPQIAWLSGFLIVGSKPPCFLRCCARRTARISSTAFPMKCVAFLYVLFGCLNILGIWIADDGRTRPESRLQIFANVGVILNGWVLLRFSRTVQSRVISNSIAILRAEEPSVLRAWEANQRRWYPLSLLWVCVYFAQPQNLDFSNLTAWGDSTSAGLFGLANLVQLGFAPLWPVPLGLLHDVLTLTARALTASARTMGDELLTLLADDEEAPLDPAHNGALLKRVHKCIESHCARVAECKVRREPVHVAYRSAPTFPMHPSAVGSQNDNYIVRYDYSLLHVCAVVMHTRGGESRMGTHRSPG